MSAFLDIRFYLYLSRGLRLVVTLLIFGFFFSGCASTPEEKKDEYADWTAEKFYTEAKKALIEKYFDRAVKLYEKLESRFPFGQYATQAQLDIAYAYYKNDEPDSAIAAADRFIKLNPTHPNVDYAYYLKGLINYNRGIGFLDRFLPTDSSQRDPGSARDAYREFEELLRRFPRSHYADDTKQRMVSLRNNLAMYEIHVADYYLRRGAYLAAAERAAGVVQQYQRTPAVPRALQIMEQVYRKLNVQGLADDAARVYALNYAQGVPGQARDVVYRPSLMERIWDFLGFDQ
jgi:outer membrane protein assembly factor BamD